jgi:hypothetical protein
VGEAESGAAVENARTGSNSTRNGNSTVVLQLTIWQQYL